MKASEWFIVIDTETANSVQYPLPYDIGYKIMNRKGEVAEKHSFCVYDIYVGEREMMKSAYYADKLPQYEEELASGERKLVTYRTVKKIIKEECEKYNITKAYAYNANFDDRALHNLTKHYNPRWWFFFPITVNFHCIWHMACQVLMARPSYIKFALDNDFVSEKGNIKTNAECCYRYLTNNPSFEEAHKGIDDVNIEAEILLKCFAQHKKMNTTPYTACWRLVQNKRAEMGA